MSTVSVTGMFVNVAGLFSSAWVIKKYLGKLSLGVSILKVVCNYYNAVVCLVMV